ncbi:DUF4291 domain-containing protein [Actinoallomurus rhizosphaericola]|uniref:DUF4291 domain-containing protein n=1 Tax=Actinoallomurus rhizosphaericola TaxID=2952536 RepID=UPI002091FC01|nr:DUF4291 domain-containing protein [Actinoallomurus rhizosphaericola]MCO5996878.1 DUF4291 domain-containing protein [Actinoallomurus rhizosphaericola]
MRTYEIRADHDQESIVVYQAYRPEIGRPAAEQGRFVPPFSRTRMTWIKPSFLWLMARSDWARKPGQEVILAVRISRQGWEEALSQAVLTHADRRLYRDSAEWRAAFKHARVRVQWDPERTLRGQPLDARSIQVGLSRHVIDRYADDWIFDIQDMTPRVRTIQRLLHDGETAKAKALLPPERVYPLDPGLARRIGAEV